MLGVTSGRLKKAINDNSLGINQIWQDVKAIRSIGVTYTNTTGKPILITVTRNTFTASTGYGFTLTIDGIIVSNSSCGGNATSAPDSITAVIPNNSTYIVNISNTNLASWTELR